MPFITILYMPAALENLDAFAAGATALLNILTSTRSARACRTCAYRQLGVRDGTEFRRSVSRLIAAQFT